MRADGRKSAPGPRGYPGIGVFPHLALEMLLVLAMAAQRWRPRLTPGRPVEPVARIAIRSRDGVWMDLERV